MRPPAKIKQWLSIENMFDWLQNAPDNNTYKRRMAIWLTHTGKLNAPKIAEILDVSTPAIWLWIRQYNDYGPKGLERKGRGGRRWGFLTRQEESELLKPLVAKIRPGYAPTTPQVKRTIEKKLGHDVSKSYIYKVLSRNGWYDRIARARKTAGYPAIRDNFRKLARPWLRKGKLRP